MVSKKTSRGRKGSRSISKYKVAPKLIDHDHTQSLKDKASVLETLFRCLEENDLESFREVLIAHLNVVNKSKLVAESKIGRRTLYDWMDLTKDFNPEIRTLAPVLRAIKAA